MPRKTFRCSNPNCKRKYSCALQHWIDTKLKILRPYVFGYCSAECERWGLNELIRKGVIKIKQN